MIVLGAGRSGTSLVAGLLADAGYHPGDRLLPASEGNPTGYFEDLDVNALNDDLLAPLLPYGDPPVPGHLSWLAALPPWATPPATVAQRDRMRAHLARRPICLKDPRFVFTLSAWRALLPPDTGFVCVFRHPSRVADSVRREAERNPAYFAGYRPTDRATWTAWSSAYRQVMTRHAATGTWLWVDADELVESRDTSGLTRLTGVPVSSARIDAGLRRSVPGPLPSPDVAALHERLRERARAGIRH